MTGFQQRNENCKKKKIKWKWETALQLKLIYKYMNATASRHNWQGISKLEEKAKGKIKLKHW